MIITFLQKLCKYRKQGRSALQGLPGKIRHPCSSLWVTSRQVHTRFPSYLFLVLPCLVNTHSNSTYVLQVNNVTLTSPGLFSQNWQNSPRTEDTLTICPYVPLWADDRSKRSSTHAGLLLWWKQPPHKQHTRHHAFHHLHLLKRKKGGEASTKAQLSYILMPRYFCLSLHSVRSFNRKQGALKCCSTTTAHWWPMEGGGMPLVSLNNCDTIHTC